MNDKLPIIQLQSVIPDCEYTFPQPIDLALEDGENWVIFGPNGAGKTFLTETMRSTYKLKQGRIEYHFNNTRSQRAYDNISYITFLDQYTGSVNTGATAYQMRWNQGVMDEEFEPRVKDFMHKLLKMPDNLRMQLIQQLGIDGMMERTVISLSSGEFRRFQLAQILAKMPTVLIIDNPYIGLDTAGRELVAELLSTISNTLKINVIIVVNRMPHTLQGFTHIVEVCNGVATKIPISQYHSHTSSLATELELVEPKNTSANPVLEAHNITIKYGRHTILKDLSLCINEGEHWAVKGQNGSGKSTLLSIICADNPQGYACDISLFGKRRGTGESIWDIKKNIGFVSPEMFRSYRRNVPVKDIVASGLYDTNGLFRTPKDEDYHKISKWMNIFGINDWAEKSYLKLSSGEQRLVLLCRAFVKEPPMLILDEPFHGLDETNINKAKNIISQYFEDSAKTLFMVSHYDEDFPNNINKVLELKRIQ